MQERLNQYRPILAVLIAAGALLAAVTSRYDLTAFYICIGAWVLLAIGCIVWMSVILSAFIDNIPYTATMLTVIPVIAVNLGIDPKIMYYGLLCGATLGGNLTPIGASANIAGIGILRKEGHEVKATTFMKYGVPFTLAAVITGYLLIWLIWKP